MTATHPDTNSSAPVDTKRRSSRMWGLVAGVVIVAVAGGFLGMKSKKSPYKVSTDDPHARELWLEGNQYALQFNLEQAEVAWSEAVDADPDFALAWARLGFVHTRRGEVERSRECMDQALERIDEVTPYERLKILSMDAGLRKDKNAQRRYDTEIVERFPMDAEAWLALAVMEIDEGRPEVGVQRLQDLIEHQPEYALAYNMLGYTCAQLGRWDEAEDALEKYAFVRSEEANPHDSLAEIYEQRGRYEDAHREYRRALEADSTFVWSAIHLARLMERTGRPNEAVRFLDEFPFPPSTMAELSRLEMQAYMLASSGSPDEALELTTRMRGLAPNYSGIFYVSTFVHHQAKNPDGVAKQLELWLASENEQHGADPDSLLLESGYPWRVRSFMAEAKGNWDAVLEAEDQYREKTSTILWSAHQYSRLRTLIAQVESNRYDESIPLANELLDDNPRDVPVLFYLGLSYEETGRVDRALAEYEKVLQVLKDAEPDYEFVERTRDRVAGLLSS